MLKKEEIRKKNRKKSENTRLHDQDQGLRDRDPQRRDQSPGHLILDQVLVLTQDLDRHHGLILRDPTLPDLDPGLIPGLCLPGVQDRDDRTDEVEIALIHQTRVDLGLGDRTSIK